MYGGEQLHRSRLILLLVCLFLQKGKVVYNKYMKWSVTRRLAILMVVDFILGSLGKQCLSALTDFILTWRSPLHNNNARHSLLSCNFFQWVQSDSVMDFLCSGIFNYPCRSCFSYIGRCSETMQCTWIFYAVAFSIIHVALLFMNGKMLRDNATKLSA